MKRFLICLTVIAFISCTKSEERRIPPYEVYLELDLMFEDKELLNVNHSLMYTKGNISAIERAGYGGVIVYHSPFDSGYGSYVAYDLSCPNEASTSALVKVEEQGDLYVVCSKCGSRYELTTGRQTEESVSKYRLQPYMVYQQGSSKLIVRN